MSTSKEKMNPIAPDSLKARASGVEPGNEQSGETLQRDTDGVGERGGVASQQTGWAARQSAERMRQRSDTATAGSAGGGSLQQDQHAGSQESATGPAGKRQTDEARPKLSRARELDK
ncbi:hypothetical protein [Pseudoduganella sp. R-34]|uniref:hypothetical protein n=1 Tax=Pseudoduganella sp. R-34 TaxID=3404062 RepID=UPI003CF23907